MPKHNRIPDFICGAIPSDLGYYLHNAVMGFPHPAHGKWAEITCAPPSELLLRCQSL